MISLTPEFGIIHLAARLAQRPPLAGVRRICSASSKSPRLASRIAGFLAAYRHRNRSGAQLDADHLGLVADLL